MQFDGLQQLGIVDTVEEVLSKVAFVDCHFCFYPSDHMKNNGGKYSFGPEHEAEYDQYRKQLVMEAIRACPNAAAIITLGKHAKEFYTKVLKPDLRQNLPAERLNVNDELLLQHLFSEFTGTKFGAVCHPECVVTNVLTTRHSEDYSRLLVEIASFFVCSAGSLTQNMAILEEVESMILSTLKGHTLKQYQLDVLSRRLWLKNQTKKGREAPKDVQLARNALASKQLRAQALAAIPDSQQAAFSQLGMDPVHESANTVVSRPRTPPTPNSADRMYSRNLVVRRAGWRIWSQPQK